MDYTQNLKQYVKNSNQKAKLKELEYKPPDLEDLVSRRVNIKASNDIIDKYLKMYNVNSTINDVNKKLLHKLNQPDDRSDYISHFGNRVNLLTGQIEPATNRPAHKQKRNPITGITRQAYSGQTTCPSNPMYPENNMLHILPDGRGVCMKSDGISNLLFSKTVGLPTLMEYALSDDNLSPTMKQYYKMSQEDFAGLNFKQLQEWFDKYDAEGLRKLASNKKNIPQLEIRNILDSVQSEKDVQSAKLATIIASQHQRM
jgi:hypothetical protein